MANPDEIFTRLERVRNLKDKMAKIQEELIEDLQEKNQQSIKIVTCLSESVDKLMEIMYGIDHTDESSGSATMVGAISLQVLFKAWSDTMDMARDINDADNGDQFAIAKVIKRVASLGQ